MAPDPSRDTSDDSPTSEDATRATPRDSTHDYATWTIEDREDDEFEFLGVKEGGTPMFFHPAAKVVFEGVRNEERETITRGEEESLEEELGQWLERVGEKTGWESLSEFAREKLGSGEAE